MFGIFNSASYLSDGQVVDVSGEELMDHTQPYFISPAFAFVAFPNRNSVPFKEFYNIPEAETVVRGSLRYQGFPEFAKVLVKLGLLDLTQKVWLNGSLKWAQIMQKVLGAAEPTER
jgi:spermidine synthase / saccharopine dehydrogenase (NADP+, L-glutamate-forming)